MSGAQLYDAIGATYTATRRTEPRIAAPIWAALGDDLASGRWADRNRDLLDLDAAELGLRLLIA
jgi:hypothetical protein